MSEGRSRALKTIIRWVLPPLLGALSAVIVTMAMNPSAPDRDAPSELRVDTRGLLTSEDGGASAVLVLGRPLALEDGGVQRQASEQRREIIHRALAEHDAARRDPAWAPAAEARARPGLEAVASRVHARIVDVDCRAITCTATIEWPDLASATSTYSTFLTQVYELNCTRTILLDEPDDATAPYRARLHFDCHDERPLHGAGSELRRTERTDAGRR